MFAGSIFDLEPGTGYDCRFVLSDPDGVEGKAGNIVAVRTRFEPKPAAGAEVNGRWYSQKFLPIDADNLKSIIVGAEPTMNPS
jgi:hypothetical protein